MTAAISFDALLKAASGPPPRPELAAELGLRAIDERRDEAAIPVVAAAAGHLPGDARLLHILGLLHRSLGDLGAAIHAFDKALLIAPNSPRLVHARARAALEAGLPAVEWYRRAAGLAPSDGDVILGHAAALVALRQGDAAGALLADMLRQHPGWLPGHEAMMRMRYAAGAVENCTDDLDAAIAGAPGDVRLHVTKIMGLQRGGLAERAETALAAATALAGDAPPLHRAAAILATEQGRLAEADVAFARLDPLGDPGIAVYWFRHLLRRGEPDRLVTEVDGLPAAMVEAAQPYLSLAWRLTGDPRAQVDIDRLVKVIDFGTDWPLLADIAATLRALHVTQSQPLDQSVRGGTQTDGPLLSRLDPVIREIAGHFRAAVATYCAELPDQEGHPFVDRRPRHPRFVGSWSVRLSGGGFHEPHVHGEGWLSSAFYVALPDLGGDPQAGWLTLGEPQKSLGISLPPQRLIEPKPGRLVLFPSTTWHGTRPFEAGERLTIAFDIA